MYKHYLQPPKVFEDAGRNAYMILVPIQNNPYSQEPFRSLWSTGYKAARHEFEAAHPNPRRIKAQAVRRILCHCTDLS